MKTEKTKKIKLPDKLCACCGEQVCFYIIKDNGAFCENCQEGETK